ncbi:glutathione S-transferase [Polaromonas sp. OV174]|uniref:glutathione S-transferase family protein n=1 Tax=Polaromonas sp. OV174 TaxID=1855300 RepID=UPI0008E55F75|nr:glutathione S-transferase family protein [Polaromonas sp. OV174]SFB87328.1 glutathione S-transferase [Polaromonas sp. OV174]
MIQLHYAPSTASMAPHILLEELGLPFEKVLVDTAQGAHRTPAYRQLNPNGLVPTLVDGELVLYESAAICLHLCDSHPAAGLAPALGTPARAHFYKWLIWLTNTLQATLIVYFYPERWVAAGDEAAALALKSHAEARVGPLLDQLDAELARQAQSHGQPWLLGANFSAVDIYALMLCRWTRNFASQPARERAHLGPYLQRVLARPAVQRALASEQLTAPFV